MTASCLRLLKMRHDRREVLGRTVVATLMPMHETVRAPVNDAVEVRCRIWRCCNDSLRLGCCVRRLESEKLGEERETDRVRLRWAQMVLHRQRAHGKS